MFILNKDDLIQLKNQLINEGKTSKYGYYDPAESGARPEDSVSRQEILNNIDTEGAINYLEKKIEQITINYTNMGIDFDVIEMFIGNEFYAKKEFLIRRNINDFEDPKYEELLYDIVPLDFFFRVKKYDENGKLIDVTIYDYLFEEIHYDVRYSDFISKVLDLGYKSSVVDFENKYEKRGDGDCTKIVVSFNNVKKKNI